MTNAKKTAAKGRTGAPRARKTAAGPTGPKQTKKATGGKQRAQEGPSKPAAKTSLLEAAIAVMQQHDEAVGTKQIIGEVIDGGLWTTTGRTPEATLYSALIREIRQKGEASRFRKTGRGRFALAEHAQKG
ncbi:MAG: winged helix-turn-helix domain-containing protein [Planctomycetota bacterium]